MPHQPRPSGTHGPRPAPDAERLLLLVLVVQVPVLALAGLAAGRPPTVIAATLAPIALLGAIGAAARGRLWGLPSTILGLVAVGYAWALVALRAPGGTVGGALVSAALVLAAVSAGVWWWRSRSERATTSLEEAERLKRELVAVVSHEFRTPLTSIRGFAQTLEERGERMDGRTVLSCLRAIEGESRRLERIVDNVVVPTENAAGERDVVTDLGQVAVTALADLADVWGDGARRIAVRVDPGLGVRMSATSAVLVLENLLDNALKFGEPGTEVRLHARRVDSDTLIEITNRGGPIREQDLERIFDPFVQVDSSDSRSTPGMGLGLATVHRLVTAHRGRVEARNIPGGILVAVVLPAASTSARDPAISLPAGASTA